MPKGIYDHFKLRGKTYEEICGIKKAKKLRKVRSKAIKKRGRIWNTHPKGMLGKCHTKEWKEQHSKDISEEKHPLYKTSRSKKTKEKISKTRKEKNLAVLERNPNWQGGKSFEPYGIEFNKDLKFYIRQRDNFRCQFCPAIENKEAFPIHHLDYNKKNNNERNLITLCKVCNIVANRHREKWELCFTVLNEIRHLTYPIGGI